MEFTRRYNVRVGNLAEIQKYIDKFPTSIRVIPSTHPGMRVVEFKYTVPESGDYAICVLLHHVGGQVVVAKDLADGDYFPPRLLKSDPKNCDYCKIEMNRVESYIVRRKSDDTYLQIGRDCITKFFHTDKAVSAKALRDVTQVERAAAKLKEIEDRDEPAVPFNGAPLDEAVAAAIYVLKHHTLDYSLAKQAVNNVLRDVHKKLTDDDEYRREAVEAILWGRTLGHTELSQVVVLFVGDGPSVIYDFAKAYLVSHKGLELPSAKRQEKLVDILARLKITDPPSTWRLLISIPPEPVRKILETLKSQDDWSKTKRSVSKTCDVCGAARTEIDANLSYDDKQYIVRLEGFVALCKECHQVRTLRQRSKIAAKRLAKMNFCSIEDAEAYIGSQLELAAHRNKYHWFFDSEQITTPISAASISGLRFEDVPRNTGHKVHIVHYKLANGMVVSVYEKVERDDRFYHRKTKSISIKSPALDECDFVRVEIQHRKVIVMQSSEYIKANAETHNFDEPKHYLRLREWRIMRGDKHWYIPVEKIGLISPHVRP